MVTFRMKDGVFPVCEWAAEAASGIDYLGPVDRTVDTTDPDPAPGDEGWSAFVYLANTSFVRAFVRVSPDAAAEMVAAWTEEAPEHRALLPGVGDEAFTTSSFMRHAVHLRRGDVVVVASVLSTNGTDDVPRAVLAALGERLLAGVGDDVRQPG